MANASDEAVISSAEVSDGTLMAQICEGDGEAMACLFTGDEWRRSGRQDRDAKCGVEESTD